MGLAGLRWASYQPRADHPPRGYVRKPSRVEAPACLERSPTTAKEWSSVSAARLRKAMPWLGHRCSVARAVEQHEPEARPGPNGDDVSKGLSAFLSSVLDQLSVTSWLPSVFLVGNAAVLLTLQGQGNLNLGAALKNLASLEWGAIVVLILSVTIGAIVIQAFEFEGLRFWEGYVRAPGFSRWARRRIKHFSDQRASLDQDCRSLARVAFDGARQRAFNAPRTTAAQEATLNALEKQFNGRRLDPADRAALAGARELNWPRFASPAPLHEWDVAKLKLAEFPEAHRVLPTRLGNVMRAAEDQVKLLPGEDLEGFMIRHADALPATIVAEHSAYRKRLEMYCGLMFVLCALAVLSVATLWGIESQVVWRVVVPCLYLVAIWVSYLAAIASARGFGQAIKEASDWLARQTAAAPAVS